MTEERYQRWPVRPMTDCKARLYSLELRDERFQLKDSIRSSYSLLRELRETPAFETSSQINLFEPLKAV